jgi:hypothetical protein
VPLSQCSPVSPLRVHVHIGLSLTDHAPQYARCARRPLPAMAHSRSSSPAAKRRHSSRGNKSLSPPSSADAAGEKAAGLSLRRSRIAIKAAMVAGLET